MNERIFELAKQADLIQWDTLSSGAKTPDYESVVKAKKFAELIVRECMAMCDTVSADYLKHRKAADDFRDKNIYAEGEAACDIIKYKMKKHFGVEE
jgi:ethanolamine utilization protein EutA (predicted chaperonin)